MLTLRPLISEILKLDTQCKNTEGRVRECIECSHKLNPFC